MSFFDDAVTAAKTVGKTVGKRAEEILIISKKKLAAIELENKLSNLYEELGKIYFSVLNGNTDNTERHIEISGEITNIAAELEELRIEISNLSNNK